MKKGILLALLLGLVLVFGSMGFAVDYHTVTVNIAGYARISATGSASVDVVETDFDATTGEALDKDMTTSDATLSVKSNKGCVISASATNFTNGTNNFNLVDGTFNRLQASIVPTGDPAGSFVNITSSSTEVKTLAAKQNNDVYDVHYRISLDGTEDAADGYTSDVTYTIAVSS